MEIPPFTKNFLSSEEITMLQQKDALQTDLYQDLILVRLTHDYKKYPRGTIFFEGGLIPGYPRIMRVLHLKNGIKRYLKEQFYVEEKVDGYNVRIGILNGYPLAFTRGGFICPFTAFSFIKNA